MKFFVCAHCGNLITYLHASGVQAVCCGDKMQELTPNTVDAAREKHLPVLSASGETVTVKVGAVEHPMAEEHHIEWIILETKQGYQKKDLKPGEKPEAAFALTAGDEVVAAYTYCNLHGLWKTEA